MSPPDDLESLWQSQEVPKTEKNMQALMTEATKFQTKIKRRNAGEYLAGAFVAVYFGFYALGDEPMLVRAGALLLVVGTAVAIANIRLRGRASDGIPPVNGPTTNLVAWHRRELERQRDLLRDVPLWYVGPFVPGTAVFLLGGYLSKPEAWPMFLFVVLTTSATLAGIVWFNRRGAKKLEAQIRDLDS